MQPFCICKSRQAPQSLSKSFFGLFQFYLPTWNKEETRLDSWTRVGVKVW